MTELATNNHQQPLQILYQDEHCIAINKPAGMLVHRSWLAKHETTFVLQTLRDQIGQLVYPVHRLDRPTSGVLLFALNSESAKHFSQAFEQHQVHKTYLAVVRGYMPTEQGSIDYPLSVIRDKIADKHSIANTDTKPDQPAQTDWQLIDSTEQPFVARTRYKTSRYSLIKLCPTTGRKHQLRRHLKHIFHPIIGDTSYGDHHQNRAIRAHIGVSRLMLHAHTLTFPNIDGEQITVQAQVDEDWHKMLEDFNWKYHF